MKFAKSDLIASQENVSQSTQFMKVVPTDERCTTSVLLNTRALKQVGIDAEDTYAEARVRACNIVKLLVSMGPSKAKIGDVLVAPDDTFPDVVIEVKNS